jgi:hypothetical protein
VSEEAKKPIRIVLPRDWKDSTPRAGGFSVYIDGNRIPGVSAVSLPLSYLAPHQPIDLTIVPINGLIVEYSEE